MALPTLPVLSAQQAIAGALPPSSPFLRYMDELRRAIIAADAALAATDANLGATDVLLAATIDNLQDQVDRLTAILAGTGESFTGLLVGGVNVKSFLDRTDGSKITNNAALADGLVSTAKVAAAAITDVEATATGGLIGLIGSSETTIATRTFTTTGGELEVSVNFHLTLHHPTAGGCAARIRVYRDATPIFDKSFEAIGGDNLQGWQTPRITEAPPAGAYTYTVTAKASESNWAIADVDAATIVVREFKR